MKAHMNDGDLVLHGTVGFDFFEEGLRAADVHEALAGVHGDLSVRLNSGGGDAFEGAAIHSALASYDRGEVTVVVEGIAASAASLLAMAGDTLVMAEGAFLMIHDPSGITLGTADDHRQTADVLDKLADEYATVYARRAGTTKEDTRATMKSELWMNGEEAVAMGFADGTMAGDDDEDVPVAAAFPYHKFTSAPSHLVAMARENGWDAGGPHPKRAAVPAGMKEAVMPKEATPANTTPESTMSVATPEPNPAADAALAASARRQAVLAIANAKMLTPMEVEGIVEAAADAADAKMQAVDLICEKRMADEPPTTSPRATVTGDADERKFKAMSDALSATMFGAKLEGPGEEYRGLTPKRLAIELSGGYKHGVSDIDMIKRGMSARGVLMAGGMHSTSDFTYLTASTMNRALRDAYNSRPGTWRQISRQRMATDFRTMYSVQAGGDFSLQGINEAGEYTATTLTDTGESFAVARYGRKVTMTFEAVINDDMSAFSRIPSDFARASTNLESKICWDLVNANGNMTDGNAFFSAAHSNLQGTPGVIDVDAVGDGRKAMWEQRPVGADAAGSDFIEAVPNLLYVPPALEVTALQFVANTMPEADSNVNPFKRTLEPIVEPRLGAAVTAGSDTAWYMFDSSLPALEHAFLMGYETPMIEPEEKIDPDGVCVIARHIFGAAMVEYRGAWKDAGA